uniref:Uncharacterized protein n=1 Tax=Schistosoma curassoni TaxID=6186 RepID=A0A183KTZ9_9TREM
MSIYNIPIDSIKLFSFGYACEANDDDTAAAVAAYGKTGDNDVLINRRLFALFKSDDKFGRGGNGSGGGGGGGNDECGATKLVFITPLLTLLLLFCEQSRLPFS